MYFSRIFKGYFPCYVMSRDDDLSRRHTFLVTAMFDLYERGVQILRNKSDLR